MLWSLQEIFAEINVTISPVGEENVATIVLLTEGMFGTDELCEEVEQLLRLRDNNPKESALITHSRRFSLGKGRRASLPTDSAVDGEGAELSDRLKSKLVAACSGRPRVVARMSSRLGLESAAQVAPSGAWNVARRSRMEARSEGAGTAASKLAGVARAAKSARRASRAGRWGIGMRSRVHHSEQR
jgi:hypothetical protein